MTLSQLSIVKKGKFATFSGAQHSAMSPFLPVKLFLELHRYLEHKTTCRCCHCSVHSDMQQWAKVVNNFSLKIRLTIEKETSI